MQIRVTIDKTVALQAGQEPGSHVVNVNPADLSLADANLLAKWTDGGENGTYFIPSLSAVEGGYSSSLTVTPEVVTPSVDGVMNAIRAAEATHRDIVDGLTVEGLAMLNAPDDDPALDALSDTDAICAVVPELKERVIAIRAKRKAEAEAASLAEMEALREQIANDPSRTSTPAFLNPCGKEAYAVVEEIQALLKARRDMRADAVRELRDAWLREHGETTLLAKLDAGYECTAGLKAAVAAWADMQIESLDVGLSVLARDEEAGATNERTTPSDAAFAAEQAIDRLDGMRARVAWAMWDDGYDERSGECVVVDVACPWDDDITAYVTLQVVGEGFAV